MLKSHYFPSCGSIILIVISWVMLSYVISVSTDALIWMCNLCYLFWWIPSCCGLNVLYLLLTF